jgi:hypothetical protein
LVLKTFRPLDKIANATPKDYLSHSPKDAISLASMMLSKANQLFPIRVPESNGTNVMAECTTYELLYVGPGSGLVIQFLLSQGHLCHGIETSRRGIASAPELVRNYINWQLPWETPFANRAFHITLVSKYMQTLLTLDEWKATTVEMKRVSKYLAAI